MLRRTADPLRLKGHFYDLADPFLAFHHHLIRPHRSRLRRRQAAAVWSESQQTWSAQILGPHFEQLSREIAGDHPSWLGEQPPEAIGPSSVADRARRIRHQIDLTATDRSGTVVALGEAKFTAAARTTADLHRLEHIRSLLGERASGARLIVFAANGADPTLAAESRRRPDVEIVDLARLLAR